ncbi:hypothetical protein Leryth_001505 [Lithospermum erythrorhizon]|nr:hypothetical protein Leryth_001505 [Lithospermum erythrorhizon]
MAYSFPPACSVPRAGLCFGSLFDLAFDFAFDDSVLDIALGYSDWQAKLMEFHLSAAALRMNDDPNDHISCQNCKNLFFFELVAGLCVYFCC